MLFVFLQTFEVSEIKRKKKGNCLKRHNRHTHLPCCECAVPSNGFMLRWSRYMVELHTKSLFTSANHAPQYVETKALLTSNPRVWNLHYSFMKTHLCQHYQAKNVSE